MVAIRALFTQLLRIASLSLFTAFAITHVGITASASTPPGSEHAVSALEDPAVYNDTFDFFDDFEFADEYLENDTLDTQPGAELPAVPSGPLLSLTLPIFGTIPFYVVTDPATGKDHLQARFAEGEKLYLGQLVLEAPIMYIEGNTLSFTCKTTLFDRKANVGLTDLVFDAKNNIKLAAFGVTFDNPDNPPLVEIMPGKKARVLKQRLLFMPGKPVLAVTDVDLFGKQLSLGIIFSGSTVGAFMHLNKVGLNDVIPGVQGTPLAQGVVRNAKIEIENIPLNPSIAHTPPDKPDLRIKRKSYLLTADIKGTINLPDAKVIVHKKEEAAGDLTFTCLIDKYGVEFDALTNNFPLADVGVIHNAHLRIDTKTKRIYREAETKIKELPDEVSGVTISGVLSFDAPPVGILDVDATLIVDKDKIFFSGELMNEFSYADFVVKPGIGVTFDSQKKSFGLITSTLFEGLELKVSFAFLPSKADPAKKVVEVSAAAQAKEFRPFTHAGIAELNDVYVSDLDIGLDIKVVDGKQTKAIKLNGTLHMLGQEFASEIRFVKNDKGETGIFIEAPLQEDVTLSDVLLGFNKPPFNAITFKKIEFIASSIAFTDPTTRATISKGISLVAKVPLTGALEKVGDFLGGSNQEVTIQGAITGDPQKTAFRAMLTQGVPNLKKVISMGPFELIISGEPYVGVKTSVTFRPQPTKKPEQVFEFAGQLTFEDSEVEVIAQMDGIWHDAFGLKGISLGDFMIVGGMIYGSPGIPTKAGGRGVLHLSKDLHATMTMMADAKVEDIALKGTLSRMVSMPDLVLIFLTNQGVNLGPLDIPLLQLSNATMAFSPAKDVYVGVAGKEEIIRQGIAFKADIVVLDHTGSIELLARVPNLSGDNFGLKAFGTLEQVNIANLLKITGKGGHGDPIIDMELTPVRQSFLISGRLTLASLFNVESHVQVTSSTISFNFEESMGGKKFHYKGHPLLLAQVHGEASIKDKNFMIDIQFKEYLQKYLEEQINIGFSAAKKEVEKGIAQAKKDIDSVNSYARDAEKKIIAARDAVTEAKKALNSINDAIERSNRDINKAQKDVDSLKTRIKALKGKLKKEINPIKIVGYGTELAALETAKATATGVLSAAKGTASGTLIAAREVAKGSVTAAEQFLDKVVKNVSNELFSNSAAAAKAILDGIKGLTLVTLRGTEFIIEQPLGLIQINEIGYHGALQDVADGVLGNVRIKAEIAGMRTDSTISIDTKKGLDALLVALKPVVKSMTSTLNTVILNPIKKAVGDTEKALAPAEKKKSILKEPIPDKAYAGVKQLKTLKFY